MRKGDVVEIFSDIQGEGPLVGVRQVFVRLAGCNRACRYCDTPDGLDLSKSAKMSAAEIIAVIKKLDNPKGLHHSVSITGGEPLLQCDFLLELLPEIRSNGWRVFLETNGTLPKAMKKLAKLADYVSVDAKLPSVTGDRGNLKELGPFLAAAPKKMLCVKAVVTANTDMKELAKAARITNAKAPGAVFIIQPATRGRGVKRVSQKKLLEAEQCVCGIVRYVRVIPQVHRLMEGRKK